MTGSDDNIKVIVRFRPLNKAEHAQAGGGKMCISDISGSSVCIASDSGAQHNFSFDRVFTTTSTQTEIFECSARPLVDSVLQGYNACLLAYGQTGSGKTHTMLGPESVLNGSDDSEEVRKQVGLIPRVIQSLFSAIEAPEAAENTYQIEASYVEIYNEKIRCLLDSRLDNLQVVDTPDEKGGAAMPRVKGATIRTVNTVEDIWHVMAQGNTARATAATGMNERSSRSHSVFILTFIQNRKSDGMKARSTLMLVDLAGSEAVGKSGATGDRLKEAGAINQSLSSLANVINSLHLRANGDKNKHIPYRDSKLTRLLQQCLGGNAKTSLIIACSPSSWNCQETLSSLRFGARAKEIKNVATANVELSEEQVRAAASVLERRLRESHELLRQWIAVYKRAAGEGGSIPLSALQDLCRFSEHELAQSVPSLNSSAEAFAASQSLRAHTLKTNHAHNSSMAAFPSATTDTSAMSVDGSSQGGSDGEYSDDGSYSGSDDGSESGSYYSDETDIAELRETRDALLQQREEMVTLLGQASRELRSLKTTLENKEAELREVIAWKALDAHAHGASTESDLPTLLLPEVVEEIWENQRWTSKDGWQTESLNKEQDPPAWSDEQGTAARSKEDVSLPPPYQSTSGKELWYWFWSSDWTPVSPFEVEKDDEKSQSPKEGDNKEYWLYGPNFKVLCPTGRMASAFLIPKDADEVRRRLWTRKRLAVPLPSDISGTEPPHIVALRNLLNRTSILEHRVSSLTSEIATKNATIAAHESRITSLLTSMAATLTTGDMSHINSVVHTVTPPATAASTGAGAMPVVATANPPVPGAVGSEVSGGFFHNLLKIFQSPSKSHHGKSPHGSVRNKESFKASTPAKTSDSDRNSASAVLFRACEAGDIATVRNVLNEHPHTINSVDKAGRSPLLYAARGGSLAVVQLLVRSGADITSCDKDMRSALAYASRRGHLDVVAWLLSQGVPAAQCDVHALTPLHQAVLGKHTAVIALLLRAGADITARDSNAATPWKIAKKFCSDNSPESKAVLVALSTYLNTQSPSIQVASAYLSPSQLDVSRNSEVAAASNSTE